MENSDIFIITLCLTLLIFYLFRADHSIIYKTNKNCIKITN